MEDTTTSTFGYHSSAPLHREARRMLKNRDRREKAAIDGYAPISTNPLISLSESAGYIPESERLRANAAEYLRREKEVEENKKANKREVSHSLKQKRHDTLLASRDDEYAKALQDAKAVAGTSLRNSASVPYNLVNHQFTDERAARISNYQDELTKHSFKVRSDRLDRRTNAVDYNIINGLDRPRVTIPPKPAPLQ
jgi:hypothetical protein